MKGFVCNKCGSQEPDHICSDLAMAQLRVAYLESVLVRIQTHSGFDNNNCAMKAYDVLCECQRWAEEAAMSAAKSTESSELSEWHQKLKALAEAKGCGFLIVDAESHRSGFEHGLTPEEELVEQIDAARSSL